MSFLEFLLFLAVLGVVVWYCWRVTRVADALEQYHKLFDRLDDLDEALFLEVGRYVSDVLLPELTYRAAMKLPDDEKTVAGKALIAALAARCAHFLQQPDPLQHPAPTPSNEEQTK